jgi:AraC-like DNA-binding protein
VVNRGQEYATHIESSAPVDALSVFLEPKIIQDAMDARRIARPDELDPFESASNGPEFFERCFGVDNVYGHLVQIRRELPTHSRDPLWLSEHLHTIAAKLVDRHFEVYEEIGRVPAVRSSTQEELYRRLYKARDYAEATLDQPITLGDLAYVACLSTNYFLRSFRSLFGVTPHQFVIERRLERAKRYLKSTEMSVSDVCQAVGFQSLGSFSWLFKRRIGVSPDAYRRNSRTVV